MSATTGAAQVLRSGVSELYPDIPDELVTAAARDEEHLEVMRELGMSSALTVAITGRNGSVGVLTMVMAESQRRFDENDQVLAEDLSRRAAVAVENALDYREQTGRLASVLRVAEAAQHAILAEPPGRSGSVLLSARYVSAAADALVGGDLYEVVSRPGAVRMFVGDVRGKGLGAVRTAAIALGEFCAAAADLDDLAEAARQIDRRLCGYLAEEDFVTGVLVDVRDDGTFSSVCCGHPPPLVLNEHGVTTPDVVPAVPLGLGSTPVVTNGALAVGDRLLLYTDGVLEARDPEHHFVDLAELLMPLGTGPLDSALDCVLADLGAFVAGELGDDLALLVGEYRPT